MPVLISYRACYFLHRQFRRFQQLAGLVHAVQVQIFEGVQAQLLFDHLAEIGRVQVHRFRNFFDRQILPIIIIFHVQQKGFAVFFRSADADLHFHIFIMDFEERKNVIEERLIRQFFENHQKNRIA